MERTKHGSANKSASINSDVTTSQKNESTEENSLPLSVSSPPENIKPLTVQRLAERLQKLPSNTIRQSTFKSLSRRYSNQQLAAIARAYQETSPNKITTSTANRALNVVARDVTTATAVSDFAKIVNSLQPIIQDLLTQTAAGTDEVNLGQLVGERIGQQPNNQLSSDELQEMKTRATDFGSKQVMKDGTLLDFVSVLRAINQLHQNASPDIPAMQSSIGLQFLIKKISQDAAKYLAGASKNLNENDNKTALEANAYLHTDLIKAVEASSDPKRLMKLELEGSVVALIDLRSQFELTQEQAQRASLGQQIGTISRHILLLNQALQQLEAATPGDSSTETPLDQQMTQVAGQIAQIQQTAKQEDTTVKALGDKADLLTSQHVTVEDPLSAHTLPLDQNNNLAVDVLPEQALPKTTDNASDQMINDLSRRVREGQSEVKQLHNQIVPDPAERKYDLTEFSSVFRRWFAFLSHGQEQQDPTYKMWMALMGEPYRMAGLAALTGSASVEGGILRSQLMSLAATQLQSHMGATSNDFSQMLNQVQPTRSQSDVSGSATNPEYNYAQLYNTGKQGLNANGEQASAQALATANQQVNAEKVNKIANLPEFLQPVAASSVGLTPQSGPQVPIIGLHKVEAQQGWSYLVNVTSPATDDNPQLLAREQKVMPPEVVQYLLAQKQQVATLQTPHKPTTGGQAVGDKSMQQNGIEGAKANSAATYLEGQANPTASKAAQNLNSTLDAAKKDAGISQNSSSAPDTNGITQSLLVDMEHYFDEFFRRQPSTEYHLAAIFTVANIEYGVGAQISKLITTETIALVLKDALKVALISSSLAALGPLGQIAQQGYHAYLATQGISNVAGLISIASFLRNASQASDFKAVRAWALLSQNVVDDLSQVWQNLLQAPVTHGFDTLTRTKPNNPRELANLCHPLMETAESRTALLNGVEARIVELKVDKVFAKEDNPEYNALLAFRDELRGTKSADSLTATPDSALPGAQEHTEATQFFAAGRVRTPEERTALQQALGDLQGQIQLVENPTLIGETVRVVFLNGDPRMEVGPTAEPRQVRDHLGVAREIISYKGFVGIIRQLKDNVQSWLRIQPGYGTKGFEARLEVQKLTDIIRSLEAEQKTIDDSVKQLNAADPATSEAEGKKIAEKIASLKKQLEEHKAEINSYAPGRGFVAAEDEGKVVEVENLLGKLGNNAEKLGQLLATPNMSVAHLNELLNLPDITVARLEQMLAKPGIKADELLNMSKLENMTTDRMQSLINYCENGPQLKYLLSEIPNPLELEQLANLASYTPGTPDPLLLERTLRNMPTGPKMISDIKSAIVKQIKIDTKILTGRPKVPTPPGVSPTGNQREIIGAHSPRIITHPDFKILDPVPPTLPTPNQDGTMDVRYQKILIPGNPPVLSKARWSTLAPFSWSDADILRAGDQIAAKDADRTRISDRATLHIGVINGVEWQVIKDSNGEVVGSFPTGGNGASF